jgi:hypothetical protein
VLEGILIILETPSLESDVMHWKQNEGIAWAPTTAISFTKIIIYKTGEFIDLKYSMKKKFLHLFLSLVLRLKYTIQLFCLHCNIKSKFKFLPTVQCYYYYY